MGQIGYMDAVSFPASQVPHTGPNVLDNSAAGLLGIAGVAANDRIIFTITYHM